MATCQTYLDNVPLDMLANFATRQREADKIWRRKGRTSASDYKQGDKVILQDTKSKKWDLKGEVVAARPSIDGGSPTSFEVETPQGRIYLRNARYMVHDPGEAES